MVSPVMGFIIHLIRSKKIDALLIFSIFFLRFYQGSIKNAYDFAKDYNKNYLDKKLSLLEFILK